ncbi:F-box domain-containing protein [Mycena sanguinolenta]|uniref:F-box domain-containing protein n=1 Tax=Mycena sanguinolenta TaxID=230812 RepID=A0A8H7CQF9_9AGAR|nr:F-box domain-containing protein [Mycena sanguinolenta]
MVSQCSACGAFVVSNPHEFDLNNITPRILARISQLLTTNEPPQEPELTVLQPIAQKTDARLACLDAEISRLKDQLSQLEEERAALAEYHAQNTTILSPLRRMPPEILGKIFSWTLPQMMRALDIRDPPWVLTHVSRRWRAIAASKSSLWSKIYIVFSTATKYSSAMVRAQIERAHTLKIIFRGSSRRDSRPQVNMLQLLLERSSMWQELRLGSIAALVPLLTEYSERLPLLRRAWVQWDGPESQTGVESVDFFRMGPSLVDISVFSEYRFIPTLLPVYHQLTRYDFDAPWTTHSELLKALPNLNEVRVVRKFDRGIPWPVPGQPINLIHLQCMYVSHGQCLDYLRAPALERIAIKCRKGDEIRPHLDPFVARSSCVLHRLCLSGLPDAQRTDEILEHCPSITELALRIGDSKTKDKATERDLLAAFVTRFVMLDSINTICPRISKLDFACEHADVISYPLYLDMLDAWWNAPNCALKATELLLPQGLVDPDPESLARMGTLRQAGLQVSFLSGDVAYERARQWLHVATWIFW